MKSTCSYLLIPLLCLLLSSHIDAQQMPLQQRPVIFGEGMDPSDSYFFVEADACAFFGYSFSGYFNASAGYQKNGWLGLGIHFNSITPLESYYSYNGLGLTYRLRYDVLEFRANAGLLIKYFQGDDFCSYKADLGLNPYYNFWVGVHVFKGFRLGWHISHLPKTIEARITCWDDGWVIRGDKVGAPWKFFPSMGFSLPFKLRNNH